MTPVIKNFIADNWETVLATLGGIVGSIAMFFKGAKQQRSLNKKSETDALVAIDALYDKASSRMQRLFTEIDNKNQELEAKIQEYETLILDKERIIEEQKTVILDQQLIIQRQSRTIEEQKKVINDQQRKLSKYEYKYGKL